jgi:hypothetical protein
LSKFRNILILLIIPIFFGLIISYLYFLRGPHYIQIPQDLAYQNIFNALNIIKGESPGMLLYPAITINYIYVLIIKIYHFFSNSNIVLFTLENIENLCRILSFLTSSLLIILLIKISFIYKKKDTQIFLILILQSFYFFVSPTILLLNLYVSAESFLLIISLFLIILIKSFEDNYNIKFTILSSVICTCALLTKLSAIPLLILPIFLIRKWKLFWIYALTSIISSILIIFSMIFFFNNNEYLYQLIRGIFYGIKTIIYSAENERTGGHNLLGSILLQQKYIFKNYLLTFCLIGLNLIIIFIAWIKKIKVHKNIYFYLLFIIIYYLFLSLRPKTHYFFIIHLFTIFLTVEILIYFLKNKITKKQNYYITFSLILLCFINFYYVVQKPSTNRLKEIKYDTEKIKEIYKNNKDNKALITAVQASDVGSGFYHANEKGLHLEEISKIIPSNEFNYNFYPRDLNVYSQTYNFYSIEDVINKYKNVYFWTGKNKFNNILNEKMKYTEKAPNLLYLDLYSGQYETISKIMGVLKYEIEPQFFKCEKKYCYQVVLKDNLLFNGLGINFLSNQKTSDISIDIIIDDESVLEKSISDGPWNTQNYNQYFIKETKLKQFTLKSNKKIKKIFLFQKINNYETNYEYIPDNMFQKSNNSKFTFIKQKNFLINDGDEIKVEFDQKIKPEFINLSGIQGGDDFEISIFGLSNNLMRFLNSEKIINGNIKIKINNEINNYSSFKLVFNKKQRIDIPINQTTNDEKDIIYYFKKILSIKIKDYFKYLKYLILQIFSKGESNMNVISIDFTN